MIITGLWSSYMPKRAICPLPSRYRYIYCFLLAVFLYGGIIVNAPDFSWNASWEQTDLIPSLSAWSTAPPGWVSLSILQHSLNNRSGMLWLERCFLRRGKVYECTLSIFFMLICVVNLVGSWSCIRVALCGLSWVHFKNDDRRLCFTVLRKT